MSFVRESPRTDKKSRQRGLWCWPAPWSEVKRVRSHSSMSWLRRFCGENQEVFIHTTKIHLKVWRVLMSLLLYGSQYGFYPICWQLEKCQKWGSVPAWYLHYHEQWSCWGFLQWLHEPQTLPSSCLSNRKAMMDAIWWLHAMSRND